MKITKLQSDWILVMLAGLLSLGYIILFYASLTDSCLDQLFNTDCLYLPSLYKDFFIEHGRVSSWNFNSSPNFVPDMLLYFPMNYLTGNFRLTVIIFSLVQQTILMFLLYSIVRRFFGKTAIVYSGLIFMFSVLFNLLYLVNNDYYMSFLFISNTFHVGTFLMALICLNLAFYYIEKKNIFVLVLMIFLQIVAFLSDRLFMVLFTIPAFLTFIMFWKNRQYLVLAVSQIFVGIIGFTIFNNLDRWFNILVGAPHRINEISYFFEALQVLIQHFTFILSQHNLVSLVLILSFASFVWSIVILVRNYRKILFVAQPELPFVYLLFSIIFFALVVMAPVLNGNYTGFDTIRYIVFAFYLAIFNIPVLLWFYRRKILPESIKIAGAVLFIGLFVYGILLASKINIPKQINHIVNYYPTFVEKVDKIAREENLKFGLANYWDAKHISMFSKSGVKIYAAFDNLAAYYHVSNEDWYYGCAKCETGDKVFNFVLLNRIGNRDEINRMVGDSAKLIQKDDIEILLTKPFVMNRLSYMPVFLNN